MLLGRTVDALRGTASEITAEGGQVDFMKADVRKAEDMVAVAETVVARHGAPHVVVANSGIAGPVAPLWEADPGEWIDTIGTNLIGTFHCLRAFLAPMVEHRAGSVVVIGSATGKQPMLGRTPYAASKLGLVGLVRSLALDLAPFGLRANLVSPGGTRGERLTRVIDARAASEGVTPEALEAELVAMVPLRRFSTPEEIADCTVFLASDQAAGITGEDLNVSGGMVMY
jgi:NAD(P)-dependent dehydrogenase (short-subunit alcohol dehydrogenase family)